MQSNWLPGRPRNNNSVLKCFSDFEDVPTIYFSSRRFNPLNYKISDSYMVWICQCYHLVSRTAGGKFFAKDEIAVFLLLHFWRCFYHYIATTTALTTRSKCLLFISGGVLWILQLGGHKFREIVFMRCHTFAILLNLKNIVKNSSILNLSSKTASKKKSPYKMRVKSVKMVTC